MLFLIAGFKKLNLLKTCKFRVSKAIKHWFLAKISAFYPKKNHLGIYREISCIFFKTSSHHWLGLFWRGLVYQQGIVQIFESYRFISFLHLIKAYQRQENATTSESDAETCMKTMSEVNGPFLFCFLFLRLRLYS